MMLALDLLGNNAIISSSQRLLTSNNQRRWTHCGGIVLARTLERANLSAIPLMSTAILLGDTSVQSVGDVICILLQCV